MPVNRLWSTALFFAMILIWTALSPPRADASDLDTVGGAGQPSGLDDGRRFSETAQLDTTIRVSPATLQDESAENSESESNFESIRAARFGEENTWRLNFYGTGAVADGGQMYGGFVSFSYFLIDNLSVEFELGLLAFSQDGPDAWGGNFNLLLRWHFYATESWSIFADAGVGFLKTNDDVPDDGSNYNFTPQAGIGASFAIGADWRALVGVRWHHISNANLADENPGRDSIQIWAGISIPF